MLFAVGVIPMAAVHGQEPTSGFALELIEQGYAFGPDGDIHLVYRLTGDLASIELTPPSAEPAEPVPAPSPDPTIPPDPADPPTGPPSDPPASPPSDPPTGPPSDPPAGPAAPVELTLQITNYPSLTAATDVDDLVGGIVDRTAFGPDAIDGIELADARDIAEYADDGSVTLTVDIPTDVTNSIEERLKFAQPGLYPIRTELLVREAGATRLLATHGTIVQRLPGPAEPPNRAPPIDLAVVTAVRPVAPGATDLIEQVAIDQFDSSVELAAALTAPVTLDVPPPIVASEANADAGSNRLGSSLTGDEFVALPAVPLDVSSAVAADRADVFARQLRAGEDILTAAVPATPARRSAWIVADPLSAGGAQELRDLGFRYLIVPQQMYRDTIDRTLPATDLFIETQLPDGGTLPLIVVDSLADELTPAAATKILAGSTPTEWAVRTVTEMLVEQADDDPLPKRSRVLSTPELTAPDPTLLSGLETLVATTPSIRFTSASLLTGTTDAQVDNRQPVQVALPADAGPSLLERVDLLDATALSAASAGSMLSEADPRPGEWAAQLDTLISTAYSDSEVAVAVARIQSQADAIRDSIVPPSPITFTLTGRSGDIEVRVRNTSDDPLSVILRLSSPKLSFPGADDPVLGDHELTLRPNEEASLQVPVRAKSNGTSPITVTLLTPAGEQIGEPVTLTSRVTAFTGLGQVLTAGLVLVLLTWWFTNWRKRRRSAVVDVRDRHPSVAK